MLELIHPQLRALALPIDELNEDPDNANKHNDRGSEALVEAFTRFGQRKPIVVRREGMIVEAGNGTLAALRGAGWTHLACTVCDDDEQTAKAYAIADNQTARLSEWDFDQLRANAESLLAQNYDVAGLGFGADELADILASKSQELADGLQGDGTATGSTSDIENLGGGSVTGKAGAETITLRWVQVKNCKHVVRVATRARSRKRSGVGFNSHVRVPTHLLLLGSLAAARVNPSGAGHPTAGTSHTLNVGAQPAVRVAVVDVEVLGLGPSVAGVKGFKLFKAGVLPADGFTVDANGARNTH